jgi:hypothetical protein
MFFYNWFKKLKFTHSYLCLKWVIFWRVFFFAVCEMQFHAYDYFCFSFHALFFISYLATWSLHWRNFRVPSKNWNSRIVICAWSGSFSYVSFFYIVSKIETIETIQNSAWNFTHTTISVFHFTHCFLLVT